MRVIPPVEVTTSMMTSSSIPEPDPKQNNTVDANPSLDTRLVVTRAGTSTRYNAQGLIEVVPANTARFNYDPYTRYIKGLLIEETRTNLVPNSGDLSNASWSTKLNCTVTSDSSPLPDGTIGNTLITSLVTGGSNTGYVGSGAITVSTATIYTFSIYLKAGTSPKSTVDLYQSSSTGVEVTWNSTPSISSIGPGSLISSSITNTGNGWYRVALTLTTTGTSIYPRVYVRDQGTSNVSGHTVYAWGAQLEAGSFATSYIPTTGISVVRAADAVSMTGSNFTSWAPAGSFTLMSENTFEGTLNTGTYSGVAAIGGADVNNITMTVVHDSNVTGMYMRTAAVDQVAHYVPYTVGSPTRQVIAASTNNIAYSKDGGAVYLDPTATLPGSLTTLSLGGYYGTINGVQHIRRVQVWNSRLTDAQVQTVSAGTDVPLGTSLDLNFIGNTVEVEWVSAASYTVGTRVIRTSTHRVYEALATHSGRTALPEVDLVYWYEVGPTNRWAMFDLYRNTSSNIPAGGFSTTLALGKRIDSIVILGAKITDITVTVTSVNGGGSVYGPNTFPLVSRDVRDYYDYFFMDFSYKPSILIFDIPPFIDAVVTVSSTASGSISAIVLGMSEYIGYTLRGHTNDALNFSKIDRDAFGNSILVPRRSIPKTTQNLIVSKQNLAKVLRIRNTLNATPAVWSGLDDNTEGYFEALLILGIYKNFSININNIEYIDCTLELEEL